MKKSKEEYIKMAINETFVALRELSNDFFKNDEASDYFDKENFGILAYNEFRKKLKEIIEEEFLSKNIEQIYIDSIIEQTNMR